MDLRAPQTEAGNRLRMGPDTLQGPVPAANEPKQTIPEQDDLGAQWVAYALYKAQRLLNRVFRDWFAQRWECKRRDPAYFNYGYVVGWSLALGVLIALTELTPWALPFAIVATFRYLEIVVWYLKLLFDKTHRLIVAEQNLIFLVVDSAASIIAVALWLRAADSRAEAESAWSAALAVFTLNGRPSGYSGWEAGLATGLGSIAGLLLIVAGLALFVGLIGERLRPKGHYTGPIRLPRPSKHPWSRSDPS